MKKRQKMKKRGIQSILIGLILVCIGLLIYIYVMDKKILTPDYAPGSIDTNAIKEEDDSEKMQISNGGGAVSLSYSNVVAINLEENTAKLYFKNPSKSREDVVLQVFVKQKDEETLIAKSDLIPAGYAIYKINLEKNVEFGKGGYDGIFKVTYYNEETGAKEIVDTVIEISINVE